MKIPSRRNNWDHFSFGHEELRDFQNVGLEIKRKE